MARTVEHKRIESPSARAKLKRGREAHYQSLIAGRASLGYQRWEDAPHGRWLLRRKLDGGKYTMLTIGLADDEKGVPADGAAILTFDQARAAAMEVLAQGTESVPKANLTVRRAYAAYLDYLKSQGKKTLETERRGVLLILPELGNIKVAELTAARIRKWHSGLADRPALLRTKPGEKRHTKAPPIDDEAIRRRKATANRVLTMLKAALNLAYAEGHANNAAAWGKRVRPFQGVSAARTRYLTTDEAQRLLNAFDHPCVRRMVMAALQTGCRYSELARLRVEDFNPENGTIAIRKSKSGKPRHVVLSDEGVAFFTEITVGRRGDETMLRYEIRLEIALENERKRLADEGKDPSKARVTSITDEWRTAAPAPIMKEACERAGIEHITFHGLRHTWASLAVMGGMPLHIVGRNLGHSDTRMVEKFYGHLSDTYVTEAIRAGAPKFGFKASGKVVALKVR